MKKCTSCTKDLPEAALHCVFCGAKQPPAPAVPASAMAKTAFGYSANEVMDQLRGPGSPQQGGYQPPRPNPPSQPPQSYQQPYQPPPAAANAKTVMVSPGGGPPPQQQAYAPPQQQGYQQPYQPPGQGYHGGPMSGGMGINAPNPHTPPPLAPMHGTPPYLAGAQARMGARPVEPWRDSLKIVMFVWGAVMIAAFVAPKRTEPELVFQWKGLGDMPAKAMVLTLLYPAIGLLSIVFAAIPLATIVRGALASALALTGVLVPFVMAEKFDWQLIVGLAVFFTLIPGLVLRNEYTDSLLARALVTIGVICVLLPYLIPQNGDIKLVQDFKALLDAPGKAKFVPITDIGLILLAVMSLLAWMPAPATGGAKVFAWAIILWLTLVTVLVTMLVMAPEIGKLFKAPAALLEWGTLAALMALSGYGLATVIGKQLE